MLEEILNVVNRLDSREAKSSAALDQREGQHASFATYLHKYQHTAVEMLAAIAFLALMVNIIVMLLLFRWNQSPLEHLAEEIIDSLVLIVVLFPAFYFLLYRPTVRYLVAKREVEEFRNGYIDSIAHDLRTPLTIVVGHAQLLRRAAKRVGADSLEQRSVEAIIASGHRMDLMVQDMVDASRLDSGKVDLQVGALDLPSFVAEIFQQAAGVLDVERVAVDIPGDLPSVLADRERLERILMNLVTNALKYSPPESSVLVTAVTGDAEIKISVADHGPGIAPADISHVFERFYRSKSAEKANGFGLGLYAAKLLVEAHGGHIGVESKPNAGTTFYFTLPLSRNAPTERRD